ncbi:YicC/YloC family endoribonuclease [Pantoea sp. Aalb]|uniref:YicC/YloC family endoribonuclease n=1 Tax=Pantoea sp. Aalb TaxID=2576762 RepID=UPI001326388F|nr:YicC/YloC family endoribonuclease [Pantoea sp. Aalb]MXP67950.1 YicC family protein [Pantoea sp. Aalb]
MIRSMTAYSYREIKNELGIAYWELFSLNHRYLEICIRLPEYLRNLEPVIREQIRTRLKRGKIECNLHFNTDPNLQGELLINKSLAKQLVQAANWVKMQSDEGEINPLDILSWPGVISINKQDLHPINIDLITSLDNALNDLIASREREGAMLKVFIEQRLKYILKEIHKLRILMPEILKLQHKRIITKLKEADIQIENNRLEQELVILAQKIDITEELDLLDAHVKETFHILKKKEIVGRRLDFMMQEFNRESNTLASKSNNTDITASAIELKVLIEQMREQVQNIE